MKKYSITLLLFWISLLCSAQEISDDVYYSSFWDFQTNDTGYIFIDQARIRVTPDIDGIILDSLTCATPIILQERVNKQIHLRGTHAPWYKISYFKNNRKYNGYIWGGMLALNAKKTNKDGLLFLSGIHWANYKTPQDSTGKYYWMGIKVLNTQQSLLCSKEFAFPSFDQSYVDAKIYSNKGLAKTTNIYTLSLLGEACGIPSTTKYFSWHNNTLTEIIETTTVSDAGVYYYDEEVQFPTEHRGNTQLVVKKIEEGEADESKPYNEDGPYYKTHNKMEKYLWDGKGLKPIK